MRRLVERGLKETATLWPPIRLCYSWVHRAAHILADEGYRHLEEARRDYRQLLSEISRQKEEAGDLWGAVSLFLKVTKSYWKGLFGCHRFPDLPRTNNDLEHYFGSVRYGERRASGRKGASPAMVVRGSVRAIALRWPPLQKDSKRRTYAARRTLRGGGLCAPHWRSAERLAGSSCVSGGIQWLTSQGSKSSCSSKLCHPRKKEPGRQRAR